MNATGSRYQARKESILCVRPGCDRAPLDDSNLCRRHLSDARESNRKYASRLRDERRAKGQCPWCPVTKVFAVRPGRKSCIRCAARRGKLNILARGVENVVEISTKRRADYDGRERYVPRPGQRGTKPKVLDDRQDLKHVRELTEQLAAGVELIASGEVAALGAVEREAAMGAITGIGDRITGAVEDIQERHGHFRVRHGRRKGE